MYFLLHQVLLSLALISSVSCLRREGRFFLPSILPTSPSPSIPEPGIPGGFETFDHAVEHWDWVYSNITNIYEKVKVLRSGIAAKCSRTRCEKTLVKVKQVKKEVEDLAAATNVTLLESVVQLLQNSSTLDTIKDLQENAALQKTAIDKLVTQASSLMSMVETQSAKISSLETTVGGQSSELSNLKTTIDDQSTKISALETSLTSATSQLADQAIVLETQASKLKNTEATVSTLEIKIVELSTSVGSTVNQLSALKTDMSGLETTVSTQATTLTKVEELVMSNTMDVVNIGNLNLCRPCSLSQLCQRSVWGTTALQSAPLDQELERLVRQ